jgi:sterol desaturase/sphingolipid hydroxylase (fatty acid hydroxylase superfamily)
MTVLLISPIFVLIALLERFGPIYGERPSSLAQLKGVVFQLVGNTLGAVPVFLAWPWLPHFRPLWVGAWLPAAIIASDFFHYWEHRLEHRIPFLWRFHAVHHTTRDLSGLSGFHHFTDGLIFMLVCSLPTSLLVHDPMVIPAFALFLQAWGAFTHSPTKLSIGPLRYVLIDNRMHRIHHSTDQAQYESNYGALFPFWDAMFGTLRWPTSGEWPNAGIGERPEIETIGSFLIAPFRRSDGYVATRTIEESS